MHFFARDAEQKLLVAQLKSRLGVLRLARALSISVLNQAIGSGANFLLNIYLARCLSIAEFGLYGIGFSIVMLYSGMGNALCLTQMTLALPAKAEHERPLYAAKILLVLLSLCALAALIAVSAFWFGSIYVEAWRAAKGLFLAGLLACAAYLVKDFFIRYAYATKNEMLALIVNISGALSLAIVVLGGHYISIQTAGDALSLYAIGNLSAVCVGFFVARLPVATVRIRALIVDAREAWANGYWALGGVAVVWLQTQSYTYLSALSGGAEGVGYANAAKLLVTPAIFLMPAIFQILLPRLAEIQLSRARALFGIARKITLASCLFVALYCVFLFLFFDKLSIMVGSIKYAGIGPFVVAWCLVLLFQFSRLGTSAILQVLREFKGLTLLNAVSALLSLAVAVLLIRDWGAEGALFASAFGELILSILLYVYAKRKMKDCH